MVIDRLERELDNAISANTDKRMLENKTFEV